MDLGHRTPDLAAQNFWFLCISLLSNGKIIIIKKERKKEGKIPINKIVIYIKKKFN